MKVWKKSKGNRIRASDKSLVYHFCIGWLLLLFVAVFLLLNLRQLLVIDWKDFNLLHAGITWTAYNSITVLIATGICVLVTFLYYRYGYDRIKRLLHRQKLARMVLENKWYEAENTKDSGFFTDLQSRSREKIVWFPKIYYQMDNGLLHILCEITMGKYQEQLLSLEDKLESGLYCELTDKTLHDGYIEYTLLYDMIANRISIDEVIAENGGLRLMKNLVWEYDSLPHALICGGTGGGKTYFLLTIIEALLKTNADLYILDPKNADLADLGTVMGNVYHTKDDMIDCVNAFYEDMVTRSEEMKLHPNYRTGENYAYLGLLCFMNSRIGYGIIGLLFSVFFSRVNAQAMQKLKEKDIIKIFPTQKPHCTTRLVLKTPKTETSNRTVWLPKTVAELLVQYQKDQKELQEFLGDAYNNYNLVIALENGNPVESRIVRDRFQKLCEQNGYEQVVFHSLRHLSTGYKLKMTNGDVKSVQGDTGHAEAEMVTDVYSEIIDEDRRYNAQKMDEQFYSTLNHDSEMQPQNEEVQPENNGLSDSDMELLQFLKSLTPEMKAMLLKQSASK